MLHLFTISAGGIGARGSVVGQGTIFLIGMGVGGGAQLGPLGTTATNGPIAPAPNDYDDGEIGETICRETAVLGENLLQCRFVHHKTHMLPGRKSETPRWVASD
jgi:hypothetical protein